MEASFIREGELTVIEFFTKLRIIWDEIHNFNLTILVFVM